LTILKRLCAGNLDRDGLEQMQAAFQTVLLAALDPETSEVSFENFESLVATAQEQCQRVVRDRSEDIRKTECLRPDDVQGLSDELIPMHDMFVRARECRPCAKAKSMLDPRGLKSLLIEYALLPANGSANQCLAACGLAKGSPVNFRDFLWMVRRMRQFRRNEDSDRRKAMFNAVDRDGSGNLSMIEIFRLIADLGLGPTCRDEQIEMQSLILNIDADGSGEFNSVEFEGLIQELEERIRRKERTNLWTLAAELDIEDWEVFAIREAFHTLDNRCAELLTIDSVRSLLNRLRMNLSGEQLVEMFEELDPIRCTELPVLGFVRFARMAKLDLRRLESVLARGWSLEESS